MVKPGFERGHTLPSFHTLTVFLESRLTIFVNLIKCNLQQVDVTSKKKKKSQMNRINLRERKHGKENVENSNLCLFGSGGERVEQYTRLGSFKGIW